MWWPEHVDNVCIDDRGCRGEPTWVASPNRRFGQRRCEGKFNDRSFARAGDDRHAGFHRRDPKHNHARLG